MINLMNHVNADRENPVFALAFSNVQELQAYLQSNTLDVMIVDEESFPEAAVLLRDIKCVILTRSREAVIGDYLSVFKYSRVKDIIAAIMKLMNISCLESGNKLFKSYAVISPIGRCGKTNLAISLCMNDEVRGGLYIGMEEFCAFQDDEDVIANVIYLAKERSEGFMDYLEQHVVSLDGYSVLGYLKSYVDAMELTAEDMAWILSQIREWGRFTTVVCDLGQAVLKNLNVLGVFDEVVIPVLNDELSKDKLAAFEKLLICAELGKVVRRSRKLFVPNAAPDSPRMLNLLDKEFG